MVDINLVVKFISGRNPKIGESAVAQNNIILGKWVIFSVPSNGLLHSTVAVELSCILYGVSLNVGFPSVIVNFRCVDRRFFLFQVGSISKFGRGVCV